MKKFSKGFKRMQKAAKGCKRLQKTLSQTQTGGRAHHANSEFVIFKTHSKISRKTNASCNFGI